MVKKIKSNELANNLIYVDAQREVTGVWKDPAFGFLCKLRADILKTKKRIIGDYKTTTDASEKSFMRSVINLGYHIQAGHYVTGLREITGNDYTFVWIVQEKIAPFEIAVYRADPLFIDLGIEERAKVLSTYYKGRETDIWPGYEQKIKTLSPPNWML